MLGVLAALGVVLVPSAAATGGGSVKKYDACLQVGGYPTCTPNVPNSAAAPTVLPAGATVDVVLTIKNEQASSVKLGSANLKAPAWLTIDPGSVSDPPGAASATVTTTPDGQVVQLRDLSLSKEKSVSVGFKVTAPCSGSGFAWLISAKEKNDFSGSSFMLVYQTGLTSNLNPCKLAWATQPATSAANKTITGSLYTPSGPKVAVQARAGDNTLMSTLNTGSVSLAPTAGGFTSPDDAFTGTSAGFVNGVATFSGLQASGAGTGFKLSGSSTGFTSTGDSGPGPFNISLAGTTCSGSCTLQASLGENDDTHVGVTGSGATFLAIDQSKIPASVTAPGGGCENYQSLGNAAFEVTGGWTGNNGVTELKYTISNELLPHSHFPLFIPLCAGGQRLGPNGSPISCTAEPEGTKGWLGAALGSNHWFNGQYRYARCNPDDGLWWVVLNPWLVVNSKVNPSVTSWYFSEGDTTTYVIKVPAPWDWRMG